MSVNEIREVGGEETGRWEEVLVNKYVGKGEQKR